MADKKQGIEGSLASFLCTRSREVGEMFWSIHRMTADLENRMKEDCPEDVDNEGSKKGPRETGRPGNLTCPRNACTGCTHDGEV
jgi:hypothetical protein